MPFFFWLRFPSYFGVLIRLSAPSLHAQKTQEAAAAADDYLQAPLCSIQYIGNYRLRRSVVSRVRKRWSEGERRGRKALLLSSRLDFSNLSVVVLASELLAILEMRKCVEALVFGDDEVTMRCVDAALCLVADVCSSWVSNVFVSLLSIVVSMGLATLATPTTVDPSSLYPTLAKGSREQTRKGNDNYFNCRWQSVQSANYSFSFFPADFLSSFSFSLPTRLPPSLLISIF